MDAVSLVRNTDMLFVRRFIEEQDTKTLLNLYSTTNSGKSVLLKNIYDQYRPKILTAFVRVLDFASPNEEGHYRLDQFLYQIVSHLQTASSNENLSLVKGYTKDPRFVSELAYQIVQIIDEAARKGRVSLILIDDYDRLPLGSKAMFEDRVLSKVAWQLRIVKVVLSSEQELRFTDRLDLRIRLETYKLHLSEKDIECSIPQKYAALASEILNWTGGMPSLVQFVIEEASKKRIDTPEEIRSRVRELLGPEYRKQIKNVVFPDIRTTPDIGLDILALLRRFDVAILSELLPKIKPETFIYFKQKHYLNLIRELGSRIYWRERGGYTLDDTLKVMLSGYVHMFEPELYEQSHRMVVEIYQGWLQREYRQHYLLEILYHQMILDQINGSDEKTITASVSGRILDLLKGWQTARVKEMTELMSLKDALLEDTDLGLFVTQEIINTVEYIIQLKAKRSK